MWVNTVDPWSLRWIKTIIDGPDQLHAHNHLRSFVHDSCVDEVDPSLIADLCVLSPDNAHWVLRDLQQYSKFVRCLSSSPNSLELVASILTNDSREFHVMTLLDSRCTGSSIDCAFVLEQGVNTHKLPQPIPVYNADSTHNSASQIEEFVLIELKVQDHLEQITLMVTNLGTNTIFLGHNWLKLHNPLINWKQGNITFQCQDDHVPDLINTDNEDDDEHKQQIHFQSGD